MPRKEPDERASNSADEIAVPNDFPISQPGIPDSVWWRRMQKNLVVQIPHWHADGP